MNLKKTFFATLNPWFISLAISLIAYLFLPFKIEKYNVRQLTKEDGKNQPHILYFDQDGDGTSERIHLFENFTGRVGIIVYKNNRILDQWNFDKEFIGSPSFNDGLTFTDVDKDGVTEIVLATFNDGDILLHCFNPLKNEILFSNRKIGTYTLSNGKLNTWVIFTQAQDFDRDGFSEIYFALHSSFSVWPRGMNAYNYRKDTLLKSPRSCNVQHQPEAVDTDDDGTKDYYSHSYTVGNCDLNDPYSDHYTWLMVLSPEMKFKFDPVKTGIYPSFFLVQPCKFGGVNYFAGLYIYSGNEKSPCYVALYGEKGGMYKKSEFEFTTDWELATLLPQSNAGIISIINSKGVITQYNSELEIVKTVSIDPVIPMEKTIRIDADGDGTMEYLFMTKSRDKLVLMSADLGSVTSIKLEEQTGIRNYSIKYTIDKPPEIFLQGADFVYTFLYHKNPYYPFRFLLFPVIYLVVFGSTSLLSKLQKIRLEQKYRAEKQLLELQLKQIKNQLDPHFTLNLIASIGDLFDKKDDRTTKYVFSKYSTLLRQSVLSADQYAVSLEQELEFVENYLRLEKFRFDNRFDFEISKDGIDGSIMIPKMLVHSFVENALKHGVRHLEKDGKIEVAACVQGKTCTIRVKDNGIGRQRPQQMTAHSTGKGLSIADRIIANYNELMRTRITYRINDLKDRSDNAVGTEIVMKIPIKPTIPWNTPASSLTMK